MRVSLFAVVLLLAALARCKPLESCPSPCRCFLSEGLKRADCKHVPEWADQQSDAQDVRIVPPQPHAAGNPIALHLTHFEVFPKVLQLSITNRSIVEIIPSGFHGLHSLQEFDLSYNLLSRFNYKVFLRMPALRRLVLQGNPIVLEPNTRLLSSRSLLSLDLSLCHILNIPPGSLEGMPKLTSLSLRGNPIRVESGKALVPINTILELDLSACGLQSLPPEVLGNLNKLRKLYLDGNNIHNIEKGVLPRGLHVLDLSSNQIRNVPTAIISSLKNLSRLELSENPIKCTCSLLGLQGWMSRQLVVTEKPVVCAEPVKFKGLTWKKVNELELCQDEESSSSSYSQSDSSAESSSDSETEESDDLSLPVSIEVPPASYEVYTHENIIKHPQPSIPLDHVLELKTLDFRNNNEINSIQGDQPYSHDYGSSEQESSEEVLTTISPSSRESITVDGDEKNIDTGIGDEALASYESDSKQEYDRSEAQHDDENDATEKEAEVFMRNADTIAMGKSMPEGHDNASRNNIEIPIEGHTERKGIEVTTQHSIPEISSEATKDDVSNTSETDYSSSFDESDEHRESTESSTTFLKNDIGTSENNELNSKEEINDGSKSNDSHAESLSSELHVGGGVENETRPPDSSESVQLTDNTHGFKSIEAEHGEIDKGGTSDSSQAPASSDVQAGSDSRNVELASNNNDDESQSRVPEAVTSTPIEHVTEQTTEQKTSNEIIDVNSSEDSESSGSGSGQESGFVSYLDVLKSVDDSRTEMPEAEYHSENTFTAVPTTNAPEDTSEGSSAVPNLPEEIIPAIMTPHITLEHELPDGSEISREHGKSTDLNMGNTANLPEEYDVSSPATPAIETEIHSDVAKNVVETNGMENMGGLATEEEKESYNTNVYLDVTSIVPEKVLIPDIRPEASTPSQDETPEQDGQFQTITETNLVEGVSIGVVAVRDSKQTPVSDMKQDNKLPIENINDEEKQSTVTYIVLGCILASIAVLIVYALMRGKSDSKDGKTPIREDVGTEMKDMMNPLLEPSIDHVEPRRDLLGSLELIREVEEGKSTNGEGDPAEATSLLRPGPDEAADNNVHNSAVKGATLKSNAHEGNIAEVVIEPAPASVRKEANGVSNGQQAKHNGLVTVPSKVKVKAGIIHTPLPRTPVLINRVGNGVVNGTRD